MAVASGAVVPGAVVSEAVVSRAGVSRAVVSRAMVSGAVVSRDQPGLEEARRRTAGEEELGSPGWGRRRQLRMQGRLRGRLAHLVPRSSSREAAGLGRRDRREL